MKSSIHLLYGIIIGILLFACTGSLKEDKAEFEEEKIIHIDAKTEKGKTEFIKKIKQDGWTIIDYENCFFEDKLLLHFVLCGR